MGSFLSWLAGSAMIFMGVFAPSVLDGDAKIFGLAASFLFIMVGGFFWMTARGKNE